MVFIHSHRSEGGMKRMEEKFPFFIEPKLEQSWKFVLF